MSSSVILEFSSSLCSSSFPGNDSLETITSAVGGLTGYNRVHSLAKRQQNLFFFRNMGAICSMIELSNSSASVNHLCFWLPMSSGFALESNFCAKGFSREARSSVCSYEANQMVAAKNDSRSWARVLLLEGSDPVRRQGDMNIRVPLLKLRLVALPSALKHKFQSMRVASRPIQPPVSSDLSEPARNILDRNTRILC